MPSVGRGFVHRGNREEYVAQTNKFRQWRPWMWGPLKVVWMFAYDDATIDLQYGPTEYTWCGWRKKGWTQVEEGEEV